MPETNRGAIVEAERQWDLRKQATHAMLYMTTLFLIVGLGLVGCSTTTHPPPTPSFESVHDRNTAKTYAFINGQWFDGQGFTQDTWYAVQGSLTRLRPNSVEQTIDLKGGFVVPPFGEAHTHNVEGAWNIDQVINHYVRDGIFYVKNPNAISEFVEQIRGKLNTPTTIDVVFAHAGLTGPNGHPIDLYENMLRIHRYEPVIGKREEGWFNGRAYFPISTLKDFKEQWPTIMATNPDFLKLYLADSEHFGNEPHSVTHGFRKGLDPQLIAQIVAHAHQEGLRVSAHIETAADFRAAIQGQVDEIAHLPGWFLPSPTQRSAVLLTQEDAQLAAAHRTVIITTTVAEHFHPAGHHTKTETHLHSLASSKEHIQQPVENVLTVATEIQVENLKLLRQAGVTIAIGSDHAETALAEALHLHQMGIFDNLTLLKMWSETTPQTIFPSRKIGRLDEGYEASFLVLQGNPLEDFKQVQNIIFRLKQGFPLSWSETQNADATGKHAH
ncbi:amidohydrolase family protein [Candidatus Nitrospira allomarina]|uniref:Amidohydrolase family protein n=1 Tax=Candidatus Nitrospira allomarina TaxID=3020900 RepID=A0AA96K0M2_9BACT|nr:amidohydrolase family protein [Candidatus Nitrospira allomarina]WNM59819.1 amidohydrolase family protein [Candidatus Nitrospira allomarina]